MIMHPKIITDISDLGVATLTTVQGFLIKRGVPVKQLQKYNDLDTKNDGEKEEYDSDKSGEIKQLPKRRRLLPDADNEESDMSDFMDINVKQYKN